MLVEALGNMCGPNGSIIRGDIVDMPEDMAAPLLSAKAVRQSAGVASRKIERPIADRERDLAEREAALAGRVADLERREAALMNQNQNRRGR